MTFRHVAAALVGANLAACKTPPPAAPEPTPMPAPAPAEPAPAPAPIPVPGELPGPSVGVPGQGEPCDGAACAPGLTCLTYFGIAGPAGPKFTSCEIPCPSGATSPGGPCPEGQRCVTIADGPGPVCRPVQ